MGGRGGQQPDLPLQRRAELGVPKDKDILRGHGQRDCCAWNSSGMCFASASQDGSVCVWDLRSTKVLAKLQTQDKNACRVVKFSSGLTDLMAFSEHHSRFHIVDARTFAYEQVVSAAPERDISGLCFTPNGSKVYSCIGDNLL